MNRSNLPAFVKYPYRVLRRWVGRLRSAKSSLYHALQPPIVRLAGHLSGSTAAVFEYPSEPSTRWGWDRPAQPCLVDLLSQRHDHYRNVLVNLLDVLPDLQRIPRNSGNPCWVNPYWSGLDAVRQYEALVRRQPRTYMEIGSGYSTLFARQAIGDHSLPTRIVSVDPAPRQEVDSQCDLMYRSRLEDTDLHVFNQLKAGDILLIDGTHTVFPGSDAVVALIDVLPRIPSGVLVGIHDIFLPWDYPRDWGNRWYGEQYLLASFLLGGAALWKVDFPTWYVSRETDLADDLDQLWSTIGDPPGRTGSSFWLERL